MKKQIKKGKVSSLVDEFSLRQSIPWMADSAFIAAIGGGSVRVDWTLKDSAGTTITSATAATLTTSAYVVSTLADVGASSIAVAKGSGTWIIKIDDPIWIDSVAGAQVRRVTNAITTDGSNYTVYLNQPLTFPMAASRSIIRTSFVVSLSATNTATLGTDYVWDLSYKASTGTTFYGQWTELVDIVETPLNNPADVPGFLEYAPAFSNDRPPMIALNRGMQRILDSVWFELCEEIVLAGYTPSKILSLDQFRIPIYAAMEYRLAEQGYFPFPPQDPEQTLDRLRQKANAKWERCLGNVQWYDSDEGRTKDSDETKRDMATIVIGV